MLLLILLVLAVMGGLYLLIRPRLQTLREHINKISACGYLAPPPSPVWVKRLMRAARCIMFIQVGKMKVIGRENLPADGSPLIVTPNHPHFADVAVLPLVVDRPARYLAARGVFTFGFGYSSLWASPMGCVPVDLTPGKGGPARESAVKVVTSNQTLVMFPEGWAYLDGVLGPFKHGAVRIAREAAHEMGKPAYIVPTFLRYGRYPGSWIRKIQPPLEYFFFMLLAWYYRRGVTVVIGKPISTDELTGTDEEATEFLKQRIIALDPTGRQGRP